MGRIDFLQWREYCYKFLWTAVQIAMSVAAVVVVVLRKTSLTPPPFYPLPRNGVGGGGYIGVTVSDCMSVCPDDISWTAQPFVSKLDMVAYYHDPACHVQNLGCCLEGQGHSKGLCNQTRAKLSGMCVHSEKAREVGRGWVREEVVTDSWQFVVYSGLDR